MDLWYERNARKFFIVVGGHFMGSDREKFEKMRAQLRGIGWAVKVIFQIPAV